MATDRIENKRQPCDCGKSEYVFYICQNDGPAFLSKPEEWYELHIFCNQCKELFNTYSPRELSIALEPSRWVIPLNEKDTLPKH